MPSEKDQKPRGDPVVDVQQQLTTTSTRVLQKTGKARATMDPQSHQQGAFAEGPPSDNQASRPDSSTQRGLAKNQKHKEQTSTTSAASVTTSTRRTPSMSTKAGLSRNHDKTKKKNKGTNTTAVPTTGPDEPASRYDESYTSVTTPADVEEVAYLAVAKPVESDLPVASEMTTSTQQQRRHRKTVCYVMACVGCGLLVVGVVVIVVVLVVIQQQDASPQQVVVVDGEESSFEEFLVSLLPEYTRATLASAGTDSAQFQALQWLFGDPLVHDYNTPQLLQRYALATLFYETHGQVWRNSTNWLDYHPEQQHHECDWYSVGSFDLWLDSDHTQQNASLYPTVGGPCQNNDTTYQHLWLSRNKLQGRLVPELALLTSLRSLALHANDLSGTIPTTWFDFCSNLQALSLATNSFVGPIPTQIEQCSNLEILVLSANPLATKLPSQLGALTKLTFLLLNQNQLSGSLISELGMLSDHLLRLEMEGNGLSGSIPTDFGRLTSLEQLDLSFNRLSGSVPSELGLLSSLRLLRINNNSFTGDLPSELLENEEIIIVSDLCRTEASTVAERLSPQCFNSSDGYNWQGVADKLNIRPLQSGRPGKPMASYNTNLPSSLSGLPNLVGGDT